MPADTPRDDLVRKVADAVMVEMGWDDDEQTTSAEQTYYAGLLREQATEVACSAVAVVQPELDRVTAERDEAREERRVAEAALGEAVAQMDAALQQRDEARRALDAVRALPERSVRPQNTIDRNRWNGGYNEALADVRALLPTDQHSKEGR